MNEVHTGSCRPPRAVPAAPREQAARPAREYCLHDPAGRPLGTIPAPATRPTIGTAAPTLYLRRS
jgi:hypothetical protein